MIRLFQHQYCKLIFWSFLVVPLQGTTQSISTLSFSALPSPNWGTTWSSQPLCTGFKLDCLQLHTGLSLFYAKKSTGLFTVDCTSQDSIQPIRFLFYPNPVFSQATLSVSLWLSNQSVQLRIVDALGRTVRKQVISSASLYNGQVLELSQLSSGVYFLEISHASLQKIIKFIKM
jgi:Secretion system C-terminal sorting domain